MSSDGIETREDFETRADAGPGDKGLVRLWISALAAADKEEENWRREAEETVKRYRQDPVTGQVDRFSFNILYASVETTVPALYNSLPIPDVRRRFNDKDEAAKFGAQIIERALSYMVDSYDFDHVMEDAVRDLELVGRGITRVHYKPELGEEGEYGREKVWEEATCEHVPWANFRRGPGQAWSDVDWIAFETFRDREQLVELNPKIGKTIELDVTVLDDRLTMSEPQADIFKRARVWEIWDKKQKEVLYIAPAHRDEPVLRLPDPLELKQFFPIARPLYALETSDSLVPIPPYRMYRHQAEELDRVTRRIMVLIQCLKWRGIRDATIREFQNLVEADDGELVPMQDAQALYTLAGGLEKAVWMMPIDKLITTIRELSVHREEIKQVIFEITGIADIMRGQTDPRETMGAQQLKTQWGSLRIQRRQQEVARYARDLFRLKAQIIAKKFSDSTLLAMTGIKLPTSQEKQLAEQEAALRQQMQMQMQRAGARPNGAAGPPQGLPPPGMGSPGMGGRP